MTVSRGSSRRPYLIPQMSLDRDKPSLHHHFSPTHWFPETEVRKQISLKEILCAKERSSLGLQFEICVTKFHWRKLNAMSFTFHRLSPIGWVSHRVNMSVCVLSIPNAFFSESSHWP